MNIKKSKMIVDLEDVLGRPIIVREDGSRYNFSDGVADVCYLQDNQIVLCKFSTITREEEEILLDYGVGNLICISEK